MREERLKTGESYTPSYASSSWVVNDITSDLPNEKLVNLQRNYALEMKNIFLEYAQTNIQQMKTQLSYWEQVRDALTDVESTPRVPLIFAIKAGGGNLLSHNFG